MAVFSLATHFAQSFCYIVNPLLTMLVRSRWLDIGRVLVLGFYGPRLRLNHKNTQKQRTRPISSHLDVTLDQ